MDLLIDTSTLASSIIEEDRLHFLPSSRLIQQVEKKQHRGFISLHSIAEFYATLTATPLEEPISPMQAKTMIEDGLLKIFECVDLSVQDYQKAILRVVEKGLKSGAIYDALIFQAALKKKVSALVTWNTRHFERLSKGEVKIVTPEQLQVRPSSLLKSPDPY